MPPPRLLLLRLSAIGDVCNTLPVVRTIQHAWPQTEITWIIGRVEAGLVGDIPDIEFIPFDKTAGLAAYSDLRRRLRGRRFPLLLDMHASVRANLASLMVAADRRVGFDRARAADGQWVFTNERIHPRPRQHMLDGLFGFAEALGIEARILRWDIPIPGADRAFAREHLSGPDPVVVISPCSSRRFRNYRNWAADRYAAVADHASRRHGARVVLTGSGTDRELEIGRRIRARTACRPIDLIGRTSLKQLLAVLEAANVVVCPDSGPAHMATAVGTPVIGLYATSNRWQTGPYGSQDLVVDRYPEAARRFLGREVETIRWGRRVRDPRAMDLIEVADVTAVLDRVLGS